MEKRAQGRPSRAAGVVGRQKIIDDIRAVLRTSGKVDTSRKGLAEALGITPALITYYFPEPDALFEEIAVPVVEQHRIKLSGIVRREDGLDTKTRDIIAVLGDLYGQDGSIFELYKIIETKYPEDYAEIITITSILSEYFACEQDGRADMNAVVLQGAVRGMCEWASRIGTSLREKEERVAPTPTWLGTMCSFATLLKTSQPEPMLSF